MRHCTRKQKIRIWESVHIRLALAFVLEIYPDRLKITPRMFAAMLKVAFSRTAAFIVRAPGNMWLAIASIFVPRKHTTQSGSPGWELRSWKLVTTNTTVPQQRNQAQHLLDWLVFLFKTNPPLTYTEKSHFCLPVMLWPTFLLGDFHGFKPHYRQGPVSIMWESAWRKKCLHRPSHRASQSSGLAEHQHREKSIITFRKVPL